MASTDARPVPIKNTAYRVTFPLWDADGDLVTGATGLDSEVSKDGGTFTDCTNEATEIATSSGVYYLDISAAEMNADTVAVIVKTSTSGAKTTTLVFYPQEAGDILVKLDPVTHTSAVIPTVTTLTGHTPQTGDTYARIGAPAGASVSADLATIATYVDTEVAAIKAKTDNLPASFPTNFASLGINASGHISRVVLADTLTAYTGNTPQTGDAFARLGAAGAGLTALGDTRLANLDAAVSTRSTYSGGAVSSVTGTVNATLVATGLDAIPTTAPAGVASNFREMVVQTWRRFFAKATKTATQLKTYDAAGTGVVTTQTVSDDGTTETQGAAT